MLFASQKGLDFVVVSEKPHVQTIWTVLEDEPQAQVATALEQVAAKLANAQSAVDMGTPEGLAQITERLETIGPLALGQTGQSLQHLRINRQRLLQARP